MDDLLQWCRCCGRPLYEIVDNYLPFCDGLTRVTHACYLRAKEEAARIFDSVVDAVLEDLNKDAP